MYILAQKLVKLKPHTPLFSRWLSGSTPYETSCLATLSPVQVKPSPLRKNFKETLSFLDVGAHYGYYTVYVSKISPDSRVYSFEPGVKHLKVLRENLQINDVKAEIYDVALSNETKEVLFHNRTMKFAGQLETETIKAITFDELNNQEDIRPEIVKIDVHGAEGKVLYGMKTALKEAVKYLFIEIHAAHLLVDYSYKEILDILLDSGFKIFEMDKFRDTTSPVLVPIVGSAYEDFINFDKWTEDQIKRERMIFATKDPNTK